MQSPDQLARSVVSAGLATADEIKTYWSSLPANQRPRDAATFARLLVARGTLNDFQSQELLSGSQTPLVLGDYLLLDKIGAGGMGQVFKAQHRHMDRLVAIKLLPPSLTKDEAAIQRFQREVKAAAKLSHPNIVHALDASVQRGVWYLVMEFVEGRDLSSLVSKSGPLPLENLLDYLGQAARGLAFAHGKGVVHRDIKPANLLLSSDGVVKILDMGLARFDGPEKEDGLTQSGQVMGTIDYMAPEQAFDTHKVDGRADLYSLGCTLYRLATGRNLYDGETMVQKLMAHQSKPIPSLRAARSDLPAALDDIFQKLVAKKPEDRYQTAAEVESALAELAAPPSSARSDNTRKDQDSKLTSFIHSLGGGKQGQPGASPSAAVSEKPATAAGELAATVNLKNPLASTDPVSDRSIRIAREATPNPAVRPPKKGPPRALWIAAGCGGLLLLLLGVWVIIRDKDGKEVARVKVPDGGSATIQAPADPAVHSAKSTTTNYALQLGEGQTARMDSVRFDAGEDLTIEAFVRVDKRAETQILSLGGYRMVLDNQNVAIRLFAGQKNMSGSNSGSALPCLGRRVHLAFVKHRTPGTEFAQCPVFIDGKQSGGGGGHYSPTDQTIGLILGGAGPVVVDEVRISKTKRYHLDRTPQEFTPPERLEADADTLALYHFDEGVGEVLKDSSGNNHHGKIIGAKWVKLEAPAPLSADRFALQFNGEPSQQVDAGPLPLRAPAESLTVEGYLTIDSDEVPYPGPFFLGQQLGTLRQVNRARIEFNLLGSYVGVRPPLKKRFHLAAVRNSKDLLMFFDGKLVDSKPFVQTREENPKSNTCKFYGPGLIGSIDQWRVSKSARYEKDFTPAPILSSDQDTLVCYLFTEGSGDILKDSSGNNHHGKIVGAKWVKVEATVPAPVTTDGFGLSFDGKTSYVETPLRYDGDHPFTFEASITPSSSTATGEVMSNADSGAGIALGVNKKWYFYLPGMGAKCQSKEDVVPGKPVKVACVYDGDKGRLFLDGVLVATVDGRQVKGAGMPLLLGANPEKRTNAVPFFSATQSHFQGVMDEVRISKSARYAADYQPQARLQSDADTLALYHFDEGSGDILKDSSGNNHHGKIIGAKWVKADSPLPLTPLVHTALHFDGINNVVELPLFPLDSAGPLTIETWFTVQSGEKPNANDVDAKTDAIWSLQNPQTKALANFILDHANGGWWFGAGTERQQRTVYYSFTKNNTRTDLYGVRHHAAFVRDGDEVKMFIDGVPLRSGGAIVDFDKSPPDPPIRFTEVDHFFLGAAVSLKDGKSLTRFFQGSLDEFRLSKSVRYTQPFTPPPVFESDSNTVVLYHFDEGQGDVLKDSSGNGHHGQIIGAKWVRAEGAAGAVSVAPASASELAQREREVAAWVLSTGGTATFEVGVKSTEIKTAAELAGVQGNLISVRLVDRKLTLEDVARLGGLGSRRPFFDFSSKGVTFTRGTLAALLNQGTVTRLGGESLQIEPGALEGLTTNYRWIEMYVVSGQAAPDFFASLGPCQRLKHMRLYGVKGADDAAMAALAANPPPKLEILSDLPPTVGPAALPHLAKLPHLGEVRLSSPLINDTALQGLTGAKALYVIDLYPEIKTPRTVRDWLHANLPHVLIRHHEPTQSPVLHDPAYFAAAEKLLPRGFRLQLYGCNTVVQNNPWLEENTPLPSRETQDFSVGAAQYPAQVDAVDWQELAKLRDLMRLTTYHSRSPALTPEALQSLKPLQNLMELDLGNQLEADASVQLLPQFPKLRDVRLVAPSDQAVATIATLPHLSRLDLRKGSKLTDAALAPLEKAAVLNDLWLEDPISRAAAQRFADLRPDVEVSWQGEILHPTTSSPPQTGP